MNKTELRKRYKSLRASLSATEIDTYSLAIANKALSLNIWNATTYHIFLSIEGKVEVDTSFLLHILQGRDKTIGISKANFDSTTLEHYLLQENTTLKISEYGIPEPQDGIKLDPTLFEVVFVPVLAYDKSGNRIGYGKGFYDRFLAQCKPNCIFIGLSFFEPENTLPHTKLDIPLTMVITPNSVYNFSN